MSNQDDVTTAWNRIHADHPGIHDILSPKLIARMRYRDFTKLVKSVCKLPAGSSILEAGCGSGRDSLFFSYQGHSCTAVDINHAPLDSLKRSRDLVSINRSGQRLRLSVELADIFHLPYEDNTFDFVFNSGVVEHFDAPARLSLLQEMTRVTRPGGYIAVAFPNTYHVLEKYWSVLIRRYSDIEMYGLPEHELGETVVDRLRETGLAVTLFDWIDCYDTISHYPRWFPLRAIAYAATVCLPRPPLFMRSKLGTRCVVIARKEGGRGSSSAI